MNYIASVILAAVVIANLVFILFFGLLVMMLAIPIAIIALPFYRFNLEELQRPV